MEIKREKIDYKLACRCCLRSDAEFYKLDSFMIDDINNKKINLLQCLVHCIQREDVPEFPKYICNGCSKSLHIAHRFMQTALKAHEVLYKKLCHYKNGQKQQQQNVPSKGYYNGYHYRQSPTQTATKNKTETIIEIKEENKSPENSSSITGSSKPLRYRCKICNEKLYTKEALTEHVKKHLDLIKYSCQLCKYDTRAMFKLKMHYQTVHRTEPTMEQLNPKTGTAIPINKELNAIPNVPTPPIIPETKTCTLEDLELLIPPAITAKELEEQRLIEAKLRDEVEKRYKIGKPRSTKKNSPPQLHRATLVSDDTSNNVNEFVADLPQINVNKIALPNEFSVGAEFIVKDDGSVEQVLGNDVVIEYIDVCDDSNNINNNNNNNISNIHNNKNDSLLVNDTEMIEHFNNVDLNAVQSGIINNCIENIDVDDIIVEDNFSPMPCTFDIKTTKQVGVGTPSKSNAKKQNINSINNHNKNDMKTGGHKCNICQKVFVSLSRLRTHLLSHKNLPKYFCNLCSYFTLLSADINRHYSTCHDSLPPRLKPTMNSSQSQENAIMDNTYSCNLCLYETSHSNNLELHYMQKHRTKATDVELRPNNFMSNEVKSENKPMVENKIEKKPDALKCALCPSVFFYRNELREHIKQHMEADRNDSDIKSPLPTIKSVAGPTPVAISTLSTRQIAIPISSTPQILAETPNGPAYISLPTMPPSTITTAPTNEVSPIYSIAEANITDVLPIGEITLTTLADTTASFVHNNFINTSPAAIALPNEIVSTTKMPTTTSTIENTIVTSSISNVNSTDESMLCDMQDFIDSTDVAAICTIPADAIQVVEGDDIVIENTNIEFDFSNEALFDDFGEENDDDEYVDDYDNDDENDNNNAEIDQNLCLTSDDDDLDDFDDEQSKYLQKPFCMYCSKKFTSQYHFENHMFLHRGLAPYRCEMCTNLYNTKRGLLKHYKGVHKRTPTRDMVQAKGDKLTMDRTPIENLSTNQQNVTTYMCAKCPYECNDRNEISLHLKEKHGMGDETFIISKLPYECSRCIRSYATKDALIKHLQRSHLVATIIEQSSAATNTAITKTTTSMLTTTNASAHTTESLMNNGSGADGGDRQIVMTTEAVNYEFQNDGDDGDNDDDDDDGNENVNGNENYDDHDDGDDNDDHNDDNDENMFKYTSNENVKLPNTPIYVCKECNYTCISLATLNQHKIQHTTNDIPHKNCTYECGICQGIYKTITLLKYHMKRHLVRKYPCDMCKKRFVRNSELERHKRVHDSKRSFICNVPDCNKAFIYKHHLKRHNEVVHLMKRFECPIKSCARELTTQTQYKRHLLSHNGAHLTYKCTQCEQRFERRRILRNHALKRHNILLSDNDIAEIYRKNVGCANPYDFKHYALNVDQLDCLLVDANTVGIESKSTKSAVPVQDSHDSFIVTIPRSGESEKAVVHILNT